MIVRAATIDDLPMLEPSIREFYTQSQFLKRLDWPHFVNVWRILFRQQLGVIFLLCDAKGQVAGGLGGVSTPDIGNGELVATECFWFVRDGMRGEGLKLYKAFEEWALQRACRQIQMVHLSDSMPERLAKLYQRLGFRRAEVRFCKDLPCHS